MTQPLLAARGLKVELPLGQQWLAAVDGIDLDLDAGESLAVVGESGCGKTLLARALLGLPPEGARVSGSIVYRGRELLGLPDREWESIRGREIALVFQEPGAALDPVMTIGAQIVEGIRRHRRVSRREALAAARDLLTEVSLPNPEAGLRQYPHRLSGGQRQRAFLAIALASNPAILIADEPTTALDATVAAEVMELLDRLRAQRQLTLVLITHDLPAVARHSDRTLVLYAGKVAEESRTADLFREPRHPYTRVLLDCVPRLRGPGEQRRERLRAIAGSVPDLAFRPKGVCSFAPRCPERFEPCERREPALYGTGGGRARCFLYENHPVDRLPSASQAVAEP